MHLHLGKNVFDIDEVGLGRYEKHTQRKPWLLS